MPNAPYLLCVTITLESAGSVDPVLVFLPAQSEALHEL